MEREQSKKTEAFYFEGLFWKVSDSHPISLWLIWVRISQHTSEFSFASWGLHRGGACALLSGRLVRSLKEGLCCRTSVGLPSPSSRILLSSFFLLSSFRLDLSQFQLCVDCVIIWLIASSFQKAEATIPSVPKTVSTIKRLVANKCKMLKWIFRKN